MKRITLSLLASVFAATALNAQTLLIHQGNVCYAISAAEAGKMSFSGAGSLLTASGRTFTVSDITSMEVSEVSVAENTVQVTYNGTSASVLVAGDIAATIDATVRGAHVSIIDNGSGAQTVTYTLSGNPLIWMERKRRISCSTACNWHVRTARRSASRQERTQRLH